MHDTEDKTHWCEKFGEGKEDEVCVWARESLNLAVSLNAEKWEDGDKFAPDWIARIDGGKAQYADLKCCETPFFKSSELFGIKPADYAITFNVKDWVRYSEKYPDIIVFFLVNFKHLSKLIGDRRFYVRRLRGLWVADMPMLDQIINGQKAAVHDYQRRENDNAGNAKNSFVLDVRKLPNLWLHPDCSLDWTTPSPPRLLRQP